jgi:membrane protease YdiL (CAAX protease family)
MITLDFLYLALLVVGFVFDGFVLWPSFLRRAQSDPARARLWLWTSWMGLLWMLVAVGSVLWLRMDRPWSALGLVGLSGWRLWGAVGLTLALAIVYVPTLAKLARMPAPRRVSLRGRFGKLDVMLPRTRAELNGFIAASLTAGFCEEFIFRGYLIWALHQLLGLWGAAGISVVAFAVVHAYQGMSGVVKSGILGAVMTVALLVFGSLWPVIVIHALIDIAGGLTAWLVFREEPANQ